MVVGNYYLLNACYMLGTTLALKKNVYYLILVRMLWGRHDYPCFNRKENWSPVKGHDLMKDTWLIVELELETKSLDMVRCCTL